MDYQKACDPPLHLTIECALLVREYMDDLGG